MMTVARPTDNGGGKEAGRIIYLDNAATTYPKPPQVFAEMQHFMEHVGGNPGRSGHRLSVEAGRIIYETREALARLFNASDSSRIILTCNCTEAINIALKGILRHGDHVVATSMEHNSVMRPLRQLVQLGVIDLSVVSCESDGSLNPATIRAVLHDNTRLIAISHASNVTGTILPIEEVTRIAHQHGALVLVDAAQTAGCLPIDLTNSDIDLLAFSGHKGLFGPQGTGGLFIRDGIEEQMQPLKCGGTGSRSEREYQPEFLPDKFESGTPNTVGIAGLRAGVQFVLNIGVSQIRKKELELTEQLLDGLRCIPGVVTYGPTPRQRVGIVSFNIPGIASSDVCYLLDKAYGIMTRAGLHCAPAAHRTIGTFPHGTVRLSVSWFNTSEDIDYALKAIEAIANEV